MNRVVRILACLPGAFLLANGMAWVLNPVRAAERVGLPPPAADTLGSQLGMAGAYFVVAAALAFIGAWKGRPGWLLAAAAMPGLSAALRLLAWGNHGAALPAHLVTGDGLMAAVLLGAAWWLRRSGEAGQQGPR